MDLEDESAEMQDFSEEENDLNLINVKSKKNKIMNSDSEVNEPTTKGITESVIVQFAANDKENPEELENSAVEPIHTKSKTGNGNSVQLTSVFNSECEGAAAEPTNTQRETENGISDQLTSVFNSGCETAVAAEPAIGQSEAGNEISDQLKSVFNSEYGAKEDSDESEQDTEVKQKKKAKRLAIFDSDSEDESNINQVDSEQSLKVVENNKQLNEYESDDNVHASKANENENPEESSDSDNKVKTKKKLKRIAIVDSDSEDEVSITLHNKSFNDELDTPQMSNKTSIYIINEKGNLVADNNPEILQEDIAKKSRFAALCDSDNSEDENRYPTTSEESPKKNQKLSKPRKKTAHKTSTEEPSGKKMTGKQAQQQRQEIRSESQRMLRESTVSLPYHKPKAHSLKEFLQNRPRFSLSHLKTDNTPPSVAMKMSVQDLEIVTKKIEERNKVMQEFYKSESESDEEDDVQSEETKTVDGEENAGDMVENNKATNDEDKEKEMVENGKLVLHPEDKESAEIASKSNEEEKIEEIVQDLNLQKENLTETIFEASRMEVEIDLDISKINNAAAEEIDHAEESQDIPQPMDVSEEKSNTVVSNVDVVDEPLTFNKYENQPKIPEEENNKLEKNKNIICEDDTNIEELPTKPQEELPTTAQEELPTREETSLEEPETSSINPTDNQEIKESNKQPNSVIEQFEDSVDFDFNLDGLGEEFSEDLPESFSKNLREGFSENLSENTKDGCEISEKNSEPKGMDAEEEHLQRLLKKYEDNPVDCVQSAPATENKMSKADFLKQIGATKPCLSGRANEVIDLDEGIITPSGVAQLMERFMKHALKKNVVKHKVQLDIINLTQGEVIKETVAMSVEPEEEPVAILETPGIKLKKLRDELQFQMAQRRSELWQQKHQPLGESSNKETCDDEKSDCGADEDILDDDEEAELTDTEDEDEEEEDDEYEDDIREKREKPRVKSAFIDEEAEESDENECDEVVSQKDDDEDAEPEEKEDAAEEDSNEYQSTLTKKPLRRILKCFTEDSDEEEITQAVVDPQIIVETNVLINTSFTSLNSTDTLEDDDNIPPNQPRTDDKTPNKEMTQSKTAVLGLLTPVQHLTGLQGFNSGSKFLRDESPVSQFLLPPDPSPFKEKNWNTALQKKLFSDSSETLDSEANMEDLAQLCSGKFPSQTQTMDSTSSNIVENLTTQDVISMCSGSFPDVIPDPTNQEKNSNFLRQNEETEVSTNKGPIMQVNLNSNEEIKSLADDRLISQLLDEEEMEQFKKKFESPIALPLSNIDGDESDMEFQGGGRFVSDSSDDEGEEPKSKIVAKKLQKRLAFSDDSDSEDEDNKNEEEINLHDDFSDDEFDDNVSNANKIVDYDSEENEIEIDNQEAIPRPKLKPSDFLENEAELSESDWDSADEDEKGLDVLEVEQGDADVFDENEMRSDLEKIHMRRVLDQDNQEIKILQELLLEDGELHGTGRQRQFRWKNIDDAENEDGQREGEIEAYLDEDESEEQWRRARHQREMFLKTKQEKGVILENDDFVSNDSNSQVLKLGQEAVRKSLSAAPMVPENPKPTTSSPAVKKPLMLLNTRGSFLARTDKFLSRLAEFTKVTTTATVGPPKNAKKIVFQTVSRSTKETMINNKRKLENEDKTPKLIKKLRLSSNLTPVVKNVDRKKKLFK